MIYYLYHIPGKKIGVTCDLNKRVTLVQGYKEGEYEVLEQSEDIDYISDREIELQQSYGYTEQTSTFPVPVTKLKGRLNDNVGLTWQVPDFGQFEITKQNIPWIMKNVKPSMYNENRCYIYNKAFFENKIKPDELVSVSTTQATVNNKFDLIRQWAKR